MKLLNELLDRYERAAMAYERLGKMTRDDDKTRVIRKDAIAELDFSRRAIVDHYFKHSHVGIVKNRLEDSQRISSMTPKWVQQTDSVDLIREDRER